MAFTYVQGKAGSAVGNANTLSVVLTSTPVAGNLICVALITGNDNNAPPITSVAVSDANGNAYTLTPNSPNIVTNSASNLDKVWLGYRLVVPSNGSKTITVTWAGGVAGGSVAFFADEFGISQGITAFDKDLGGGVTGTTSTTINTPSITPAGPSELLYAAAGTNQAITAPTGGGSLGVWTGSGAGITNNVITEYLLSASVATPVQFTQGVSATWSAMAMAFALGTSTSGDKATSLFPLNLLNKLNRL